MTEKERIRFAKRFGLANDALSGDPEKLFDEMYNEGDEFAVAVDLSVHIGVIYSVLIHHGLATQEQLEDGETQLRDHIRSTLIEQIKAGAEKIERRKQRYRESSEKEETENG